jgi:CDI immunity proteins
MGRGYWIPRPHFYMGTMQLDFDKTKSLQELEADAWRGVSTEQGRSTLERRVYRLSGVPLCEFSADDLRLFLSQGLSLDHVVPLAIELLADDPWTPGNSPPGFFNMGPGSAPPGYLLRALVLDKEDSWCERPDLWRAIGPVLKRAVDLVRTLDEITYEWILSLPGEHDESELELVLRAHRKHQQNPLFYLGLDYSDDAPQTRPER